MPPWDDLTGNIEGQLSKPSIEDPISPQGFYLACLTKVDQVAETSNWFLLFDMIPAEAAFLALNNPPSRWPLLPTILFSVTGSPDAVVRKVLVPPSEGPIEGSWYALHLSPDGDPSVVLTGELYPPADEFLSPEEWTPRYGTWHIDGLRLAWIPATKDQDVILVEPPASAAIYRAGSSADGTLLNHGQKRSIDALAVLPIGGRRTSARAKRRRLVPVLAPPPAPPAFGAIGVMDIGQGGCNLLFDRTLEPIFYYDVGYPLGFFRASLPATMQTANPAFTGPIYQNTAGNLEVILSHWDWDHWRLGAYVSGLGQSLGNLPWTFPMQLMSPTAQNFVNNTLVAPVQIAGGAAPQVVNGGVGANAFTYTIYKAVPPIGAFGGVLINNSGLAVRVSVDLAAGQASAVLMTGDCNFDRLPLAARAGLTGINAVHHGSIAHGASANLPAAPVAGGYLAYSYGVSGVTGNHSYGFPVPGAILNYQAAAWNAPLEVSTAEGPNLNIVPPLPPPTPQGNVRLGNQGALPGAYAGTSFAAIGATRGLP